MHSKLGIAISFVSTRQGEYETNIAIIKNVHPVTALHIPSSIKLLYLLEHEAKTMDSTKLGSFIQASQPKHLGPPPSYSYVCVHAF